MKVRRSSVVKIAIALLIIFTSLHQAVLAENDGDKTINEMFQENGQNNVDSESEVQPDPVLTENPFFLFLKTIMFLIIILVLIYALVRFLSYRNQAIMQNQFLHVVSSIHLGNQKWLKLIKFGDRYLLLGVGDDVRFIQQISEEDEIEALEQWVDSQREVKLSATSDLMDKIKRLMRRSVTKEKSTDFEEHLKQKMKTFMAERKSISDALLRDEPHQGRVDFKE